MNQPATRTGNPFALPKRRLIKPAICIVALTAIALIAVFVTRFFLDDGPLNTNGGETTMRTEPGALYTWGMPIPDNETGKDIRIESVEPFGIEGDEVVGVTLTRGAHIGVVEGYPPEGYDLELLYPSGVMLPADSGIGFMDALFGVRLKEGAEVGTIEGIRLRYRSGLRTYEAEFPHSLRMMTPEAYEQYQANR